MELDTKFFLNLDLDSSDTEEESNIQQIFQNDMQMICRDGPDYIKTLGEQMEALDKLEKSEFE